MLVIVDEHGEVITSNGRAIVSGDQNGKVSFLSHVSLF